MNISANLTSHAPAADVATHPKLVNAAQQFESMLLQEMLKPMRSGQDSWGGDISDNPDNSGNSDSAMDTISSFGTEAMATAISKGGGFGIARQVIRQVTLEHQRDVEKSSHGTKV
jgi:Rod binding domain-containing protein